jgi:pimeloyl-ACP methyl ester carboxylesterase
LVCSCVADCQIRYVSAWISPSNAPKLKQDIAGSQLTIIPDAGHVPHEEKPVEFNRWVIDFAQGLK